MTRSFSPENPAHIGILKHSGEGALLCYRTALLAGIERLGAHSYPTLTMSGRALAHSTEMWDAMDLAGLRALFHEDCEVLARACADFAILPDNTAHVALEFAAEPLPLPFLHIGEVVAEHASQRGFSKVGILGTSWTMEGPVYPGALGRRGIDYAIPELEMRQPLHDHIMDEFCQGIFTDEAVRAYEQAAADLAAAGCDAVAAVCTEIPIILTDENSPVPVIDSTRLLAREAVAVAVGDRAMPQWRGGPVV